MRGDSLSARILLAYFSVDLARIVQPRGFDELFRKRRSTSPRFLEFLTRLANNVENGEKRKVIIETSR